jgi:maleylacetoacetate isomerase
MKLHGYFRSSATYRVRIALALKGLGWEQATVHLAKGHQFDPGFQAINPQSLIPVLEDGGRVMTQSLAIIEYLDEMHPQPPLLPATAADRQRVRAIALAIACDIHPLNNLRVLKYLTGDLGLSEDQKLAWYRHWVIVGFEALEPQLANDVATGRYCHGDQPGLADVALVPQVANARRFGVDLAPYPTIRRIDEACRQLAPFRSAAPENQPDAE